MPPDDLKENLANFVSFAQTLKGDEKSEAQSFIDQFFPALGHKSAIEAGATFEFRVAKKPGWAQLELIQGNGASLRPKSSKKFADLLWPDRVLIEMKSRGVNLEKHNPTAALAIRDSRIAEASSINPLDPGKSPLWTHFIVVSVLAIRDSRIASGAAQTRRLSERSPALHQARLGAGSLQQPSIRGGVWGGRCR